MSLDRTLAAIVRRRIALDRRVAGRRLGLTQQQIAARPKPRLVQVAGGRWVDPSDAVMDERGRVVARSEWESRSALGRWWAVVWYRAERWVRRWLRMNPRGVARR